MLVKTINVHTTDSVDTSKFEIVLGFFHCNINQIMDNVHSSACTHAQEMLIGRSCIKKEIKKFSIKLYYYYYFFFFIVFVHQQIKKKYIRYKRKLFLQKKNKINK